MKKKLDDVKVQIVLDDDSESTKKHVKIIIILILIILALLAAGYCYFYFTKINKKQEEEVNSISKIAAEPKLIKVIKMGELNTYQVDYDGVVTVYSNSKKKDKKEVAYYVAYNAQIKAGIDTEKVKLDVDDENHKVIITLPEVEIEDNVNVDITTLKYMFIDEDANDKTVSQEAYKACINDAKKEANKDKNIKKYAKENVENSIRASIGLLLEQQEEPYTLEFKYEKGDK
ncbi:MAG: DUF4230 domain-containing protein [Lachnospiraceae bacterium]|nr:DUF4230 domain-containing protein [Lachnospiraceae bacterium]